MDHKNSSRDGDNKKSSRIPSKSNLATRSEVTNKPSAPASHLLQPSILTKSLLSKRPISITQSDLTTTTGTGGYANEKIAIGAKHNIGGGGGGGEHSSSARSRFGLLRYRSKSDLDEKTIKIGGDNANAAKRPVTEKVEKVVNCIVEDHKTATSPTAAGDRSTQVRRNAEKRTIEQQLSIKKKTFYAEKQKLREAQSQLMDLYRSLQTLQEKMNTLTGRDDRAADELRLVAYVPPLLGPPQQTPIVRTMLDENILRELHDDLEKVYKNGLRLCKEFLNLNYKHLNDFRSVSINFSFLNFYFNHYTI